MILSNTDIKLMKDTQYRKELSIAFFNATNSALSLVVASLPKTASMDKKLTAISEIRNHFLDEYKQYRIDILDATDKSPLDPSIIGGLDKAKKLYENTSNPATDGGVV